MQQLKVPTARINEIIQRRLSKLSQPGVISIRPGFKMRKGWPTKQQAVVVTIAQGAAKPKLPRTVLGIPVDVRTATTIEQLNHSDPFGYAKLALRRPELRDGAFVNHLAGPAADLAVQAEQPINAAKEQIPYTPPPGVSLSKVSGTFAIT